MAWPWRRALQASGRNAKTFRRWERGVATTASIRATNRPPASLWVPKLTFRHKTAGRLHRCRHGPARLHPQTVDRSQRQIRLEKVG